MGLLDFLDNALNKCIEYTPQVMEQIEKVQEKEMRKAEKYDREIEIYKKQYSFFTDDELLEELNKTRNDSTIKHRKVKIDACLELFNERGFEIGADNKVRRKTI